LEQARRHRLLFAQQHEPLDATQSQFLLFFLSSLSLLPEQCLQRLESRK